MNFSAAAENSLGTFLKDDFIIKFSADYGSGRSGHRNLIRQDIFDRFGYQFTSTEKESFFDLKRIPQIPRLFLSISHAVDLGVWVVGPSAVGIDIEQSSRLTEKLIARISSQDEMSSAQNIVGSWKPLWTAKESAFKAFSQISEIQLMSEIEIRWEKAGGLDQGEYFHASHNQTNKKIACKGFAILSNSHSFSLTILNP